MILEFVGALAALGLLAFLVVSLRRRQFLRRGGTVECGLRRHSGGEAGVWRLGLCRYSGDELHWYRAIGFRPRPRQVIHRRGLVITGRRAPAAGDTRLPLPDPVVVEVKDGDRVLELAMSSSALIGFLAWLEASPPGFPADLNG